MTLIKYTVPGKN